MLSELSICFSLNVSASYLCIGYNLSFNTNKQNHHRFTHKQTDSQAQSKGSLKKKQQAKQYSSTNLLQNVRPVIIEILVLSTKKLTIIAGVEYLRFLQKKMQEFSGNSTNYVKNMYVKLVRNRSTYN